MLFAYRVAQIWIDIESRGRLADLPDADQFGLLMNMCSGGSLLSFLNFLIFISPFSFRENSYWLTTRTSRSTVKPILRWTAAVFGISLFLTLAIQAVDIWVHKTLETVSFSRIELLSRPAHNYSKVLRSACFQNDSGSASVSLNGYVDTSCVFGSDGFLYDPIETFATITNTSNTNSIVNDGPIAYIIPAITLPSVNFKAETIGVNSSCQVVTSQCDLTYPSSGYASFTCNGAFSALSGLMYANQVFEISMLNGTEIANPFWVGGYGCFKDYSNSFASISPSDFLNVSSFNTGIYVGLLQSCTILACEIAVSNLNYTSMLPQVDSTAYTNNVSLVRGDQFLATDQTTKALVGAISQSYGVDTISQDVTSAAVKSNTTDDFASYVALSISQVVLGVSAGAFTTALCLSENRVTSVIGTKVPLVPISIFFALQILFILFCAIIAAFSIGVDRSNGAFAIRNARHALIDIQTLITEHFGSEGVYPPSESRLIQDEHTDAHYRAAPTGGRLSMRSRNQSATALVAPSPDGDPSEISSTHLHPRMAQNHRQVSSRSSDSSEDSDASSVRELDVTDLILEKREVEKPFSPFAFTVKEEDSAPIHKLDLDE